MRAFSPDRSLSSTAKPKRCHPAHGPLITTRRKKKTLWGLHISIGTTKSIFAPVSQRLHVYIPRTQPHPNIAVDRREPPRPSPSLVRPNTSASRSSVSLVLSSSPEQMKHPNESVCTAPIRTLGWRLRVINARMGPRRVLNAPSSSGPMQTQSTESARKAWTPCVCYINDVVRRKRASVFSGVIRICYAHW